ncbi:MAG: hypothetical protein JO316_06560 [Abitibacteriaceae bacterium]|nr:hypothetical protein [Abditibacteriaceae bacterium]MBV9864993.1 hypothetical protein [Abditibacteriaceae bacterium]
MDTHDTLARWPIVVNLITQLSFQRFGDGTTFILLARVVALTISCSNYRISPGGNQRRLRRLRLDQGHD